jgi:nitrogen fixation protein FixH
MFLTIALGVAAVAASAANAVAGPGLPRTFDIKLTRPAPTALKAGKNDLEVVVKAPSGKPVDNADVSVEFLMPRTEARAEMRNEIKLRSAREGTYIGSGDVTMPGKWKVTIIVRQEGKEVARKKMTVTAA